MTLGDADADNLDLVAGRPARRNSSVFRGGRGVRLDNLITHCLSVPTIAYGLSTAHHAICLTLAANSDATRAMRTVATASEVDQVSERGVKQCLCLAGGPSCRYVAGAHQAGSGFEFPR